MKIQLDKISTRPPEGWDKEKAKLKLAELQEALKNLQDVFFADGRYALLLIFQGMDASGKDGAVKNTLTGVNPMGLRTFSFKKPSDLEMSHDFLWRIHQVVPPKGMIHVFNRSHYEDILIQRVHQWIDEETVEKRMKQINDFEQMLVDNDTIILKFYLHVSYDEQLKRLQERISDPKKKWKHNEADMQERAYWPQYMKAYEDALENCSKAAKWHIIPTDSNKFKEEMIASIIRETLEKLDLKYPE